MLGRDFRRFLVCRLVNAFVSKCNLLITPRFLPTDAGSFSSVTHKQPASDPLFLEPKDHNKETTERDTLYVSCT